MKGHQSRQVSHTILLTGINLILLFTINRIEYA